MCVHACVRACLVHVADLSTSISTSLCPTNPVPPVTTHTAGTGGYFFFAAAACSGDSPGAIACFDTRDRGLARPAIFLAIT